MEISKGMKGVSSVPEIAGMARTPGKKPEAKDSFQQVFDLAFAKSACAAKTPDPPKTEQPTAKSWRGIQAERAQVQTALPLEDESELVVSIKSLLEKISSFMQGDIAQQEDLAGLLSQLKQQLQKLMEQQGAEVAGLQAGVLFAKLPMQELLQTIAGTQQTTPTTQTDAVPQNTLAQQMAIATPEQWLQLVLQTPPQQLAELLQTAVLSANQLSNAQTAPLAQQGMPEGQPSPLAQQVVIEGQPAQSKEILPGTQMGTEKQSVQGETGEILPTTDKATAEQAFSTSIRAAKEGLAQSESRKEPGGKKEPEIDALQKQVDTGVFAKNTVLELPKAPTPEPVREYAPLDVQLSEGLAQGIKAGNGQFVIKLMPEGLGEVTVYLSKTPEGIMVNLMAKEGDTQKLLMKEIGGLRESLRALEVEIKTVTAHQPEEMGNYQQSFNNRQPHHRWQDFEGPAYYGEAPLTAQQQDTEQETPTPLPSPNRVYTGMGSLNAYI